MTIDSVALSVLRSTPDALQSLLATAPEGAVLVDVDDGWSARDALAHLVDTETGVLAARVRRIVDEDRPFIRSIDAPRRLIDGGYRNRVVASLLDELASARRDNVEWLATLSDADLVRIGDHDEAGEISASDIVHQWAYHDLMHLKQIASILQQGLVAHMGNTRKFYDV
jgi:hypothetical protein